MTFVALMLQKILGNICFSKQLGVPVPSPPPPPHTPPQDSDPWVCGEVKQVNVSSSLG